MLSLLPRDGAGAFYACDGGGNPSLPPCPKFNVTQSFPSIGSISQSYSSELEGLKRNMSRTAR